MNVIDFLIESNITTALGWTMIHSVWQFLFLAMVAKVAMLVCRDNPSAKYLVALSGLIAAVLVAAVTTLVVYESAKPIQTQVATNEIERTAPATQYPISDIGGVDYSSDESESSDVISSGAHPTNQSAIDLWSTNESILSVNSHSIERLHRLAPWLALLWGAGIIICLARPAFGTMYLVELRRKSEKCSVDLNCRTLQLAKSLGMKKKILVANSALVKVPTVIGVFRPMILLPVAVISGMTAAELDAILLHELAHIRRRDSFWVLVQVFVETLFFFHPAIWWLSWVANSERENCCDDVATGYGSNDLPLAQALLKLAGRPEANALSLSASGGSVKNRIQRLLTCRRDKQHLPIALLSFLLCTTVGMACAGHLLPAAYRYESKTDSSFEKDDNIALEKTGVLRDELKASYFSTKKDLESLADDIDVLVHDNANQNNLDDATAKAISERFFNLKVLVLPYCRSLTDEGVQALSKLDSLMVLRLAFGEKLSAKSATALSALENLEVLDISYCRNLTTDEPVKKLLNIPSLKSLVLTRHSANGVTSDIVAMLESRDSFQMVYVTQQAPLAKNNRQEAHSKVKVIKDRPGAAAATFDELVKAYEIEFAAQDQRLVEDEGVPLADAVRVFNRTYYSADFDRAFQPVTVDEIIAGLRNAEANRKDSSITNAEFAQLQKIIESQRLPDGFTLEAMKGLRPNDFTQSTHASVRIRIQRSDKTAIVFPVCEFTKALTGERPWALTGKVTGKDGLPMAGIEVIAFTEIALYQETLIHRKTGVARTNEKGEFEIRYGLNDEEAELLLAHARRQEIDSEDAKNIRRFTTVVAKRDGYFTKNLGTEIRGGTRGSLDLEMLPTTRIRGRIFRGSENSVSKMNISISGLGSHPLVHSIDTVKTDEKGEFEIKNVPTGISYQILIASTRNGNAIGWATPKLPVVAGDTGNTHLLYWPDGRETDFSFRQLHLMLNGDGEEIQEARKKAAARQLEISYDGLGTNDTVIARTAFLEIGDENSKNMARDKNK